MVASAAALYCHVSQFVWFIYIHLSKLLIGIKWYGSGLGLGDAGNWGWAAENVLILCFSHYFEGVDFFDYIELIFLDFPFDSIYFVSHFVYSSLHDLLALAALIVELVNFFEFPAKRTVVIVILCIEDCLRVGFWFDFFNALELSAESFVDVVIGVIDAVLADGVDFVDAVEGLWVFNVLLLFLFFKLL